LYEPTRNPEEPPAVTLRYATRHAVLAHSVDASEHAQLLIELRDREALVGEESPFEETSTPNLEEPDEEDFAKMRALVLAAVGGRERAQNLDLALASLVYGETLPEFLAKDGRLAAYQALRRQRHRVLARIRPLIKGGQQALPGIPLDWAAAPPTTATTTTAS
jgi:hypothetical protein